MLRALERLAGRQLVAIHGVQVGDIATHWVSSSAVPDGGPVLELSPGMAAVQSIDVDFNALLEASVEAQFSEDFDAGFFAVSDGRAMLVRKELGGREGKAGWQTLELRGQVLAPEERRLLLVLAHSGRRGVLKARLARWTYPRASGARICRLQSDGSVLPSEDASGQGSLAMRVAGRAPQGVSSYVRAAPMRGAGPTRLYCHGLPKHWQASLGAQAVTGEAWATFVSPEPVLLLGRYSQAGRTREVVRAAQACRIPIIAVDLRDPAQAPELQLEQLVEWSDVVCPGDALSGRLDQWLAECRRRNQPKMTVVSVITGAAWLGEMLEAFGRQRYAGETEYIFVDDSGEQAPSSMVMDWARRSKVSCKVESNQTPLGTGASQNLGIAMASGDIVVLTGARSVMSGDFLSAHAAAHSFGDCDVVIGPTVPGEPGQLDELERRPELVSRRAQRLDQRNPAGFLNTHSANFSIRKEALDGPLFDGRLDGRAADVEMGYRLYRRGLRFKYTSDAFSVAGTQTTQSEPLERFLATHPEAAGETGERLQPRRAAPARRTLRILTYRWHVSHQYELYKLGHRFSLMTGLAPRFTNGWDFGQRPLPDNALFVPGDGIDEKDYDLAVLHFDENVLSPENTNGALGPDWGAAFRFFMERIGLPKVAICHGTPQFHGQYDASYDKPDLLQAIEPARRKLVEYLGDTLVICNSHQAQAEWGFRRSRVIWHGFDPAELPPAACEKGILSPLGPLVTSRPHYRGYFLYRKVFEDFPEDYRPSTLFVPDPSPLYRGNQFAIAKYRNYVDAIRRYCVYFNPTLRSPMPRARGEPMMCGVATVSARNHDVDMFIKNGVNGFYAETAEELRDHLLFLCRNPAAAKRVGSEGRRTAVDVFHIDRYLAEWRDVISGLA